MNQHDPNDSSQPSDSDSLRRARAALRAALIGVPRQDVQDMEQDAFLRVLTWQRGRCACEPARVPCPRVLARAARHARIDAARRSRRRPMGAWPELDVAGATEEPVHQLAAREQRTKLLDVIARLPRPQRTLLEWRFVAAMSWPRIAEHLGCPADAARMRVHRVLRRLHDEIARWRGSP